MSFFSNRKQEKNIAVLDIGSSSVGGAIISLSENNLPEMLFSVREEMIFQPLLNMDRFATSMRTTLEKVLNHLKKHDTHPDEFVCFLASPWYRSVTKTVSIEKKDPFFATKEMIDNLIQKEIDASQVKIDDDKNTGDTSIIVDTQNIQIKLNGYKTNNPYNKKVKTLEVSFFRAMGFSKTLSTIEDSVFRVFGLKDVTFHAFPLTAFVVIRDIFVNKDNFLFLDITGEITDVSLVKSDVLTGVRSFPFGKNFVIRRISSHHNAPPEEAMSLFNMVGSGKSDAKTREKLDVVLLEAKKEWLSAFSKAMIDVTNGHPVPNTIFFTADDEVAEYFSKALETEKFACFGLSDSTMMDVRFLNAKTLENFCKFSKKYEKGDIDKDAFLIIESIFIHRANN